MTPADINIEGLIHDLPRWINIVRYVNDGRDTYGEQEHHEAMTLALDQLYDRVVELRERMVKP